jgi:hypothetical protein
MRIPRAYAPIAVSRLLRRAQTELAGMPLNSLAKTNEWHFDIANGQTIRRKPLLSRRRPLSPREDERERITRARRSAEALFTTKRQVTKQSSVSESLPSVHQSPRKPRVLKALPPTPVRHEEGQAPVESQERITSEIATSQFARIRAWVKYGMSVAQVAGVYGVAVDVIERILRQT